MSCAVTRVVKDQRRTAGTETNLSPTGRDHANRRRLSNRRQNFNQDSASINVDERWPTWRAGCRTGNKTVRTQRLAMAGDQDCRELQSPGAAVHLQREDEGCGAEWMWVFAVESSKTAFVKGAPVRCGRCVSEKRLEARRSEIAICAAKE